MAFTSTKIKITGVIEVKTGLHIGGDDSFAAIGAIDSPVVRDPKTREPIIPGSSIKGKLRTLLAREKGTNATTPSGLRGSKGFENDVDEVARLFGSSKKQSDATGDGIQQSRLMFKDAFLLNKADLPQIFENKFENTIDRLTAVANPRQIERVVRGAEFDLEIIYNVEDPEQISEDFANIKNAIKLLENDYLGGGGTRGSGRVIFKIQKTEVITGDTAINIPSLTE